MKRVILFCVLAVLVSTCISCKKKDTNPFWDNGNEFIEKKNIFSNERFPNIVTAIDGSLIASWGSKDFRVRRSEDGGKTWSPEIFIVNPGFQGGGTTVDENTGDILAFVEDQQPPAPLTIYRSTDNGITWVPEKPTIYPDEHGNMPSMHMNEHGITLKNGKYSGRLIRPTRYYGKSNEREDWPQHYTNAIYSDDGGKTWHTSSPFPALGTGEATIEELSDGTLYYNSRRHLSLEGPNPRKRYIAWSYDGGGSWENMTVSEELPDGAQHTDYGLMGGLVRLPIEGYDILLFSNIDVPNDRPEEEIPFELRTSRRMSGTIWASFDGGKTWPIKRLIEEGSFAYSSMTAGREGTPSEGLIYLLYESDGGAKVARFNLDWVTNGRNWKKFIE